MSHEDAPRPRGVTVNGASTSEIFVAHLEQGVPVSAQENTRLVQSVYEAFGRGDLAALAEVMADDIEWVDPGDPDDNPNAGTFKGRKQSAAGLVVLHRLATTRRSSHESSSPRTTRWYPWCTPRQRFGTRAARLSIMRHTCGRSGMGNSPDSRSISTPQRRMVPTAWSSLRGMRADRTWRGPACGNVTRAHRASVRECHPSKQVCQAV
jgi:hypothetical protein